ncbi:MAG: glycosyltransferase [Bacteroidota bacterium]|nr:glycosyltransferase [Bacteroidota bacterium]
MKILFLGDIQHPNSKNWISALEKYGKCEIITWSLPWPYGIWSKFKRISAWFLAFRSIRQIIKREAPDLVIGYRLTSYGFIAGYSKHPIIVTAAQGNSDVNGPLSNNFLGIFFKRKLALYATRNSKLVHAWAENMAESIYGLGVPKNKVLVLHRGIDLANFTAPDTCFFERLELIVTRALYKEYRHDIILKALKIIVAKHIPVKLKIIGIGVEENNIKKLIKELDLEAHVRLLGQLNNIQLNEELNKSNVYVSMPITEGLSSSLIEAMACKCVPVVSDLYANRIWVKHNDNGFLVPVDDVVKLAEVFENIFTNKNSFTKILERNRKMVEEKCSQEVNTKIFVSHYSELINKEKSCVG